MASNPTVPPSAQPVSAHRPQRRGWLAQLLKPGGAEKEIAVYHHSTIFYWWPVWLLGFICAVITYVNDRHLAIVPAGTTAVESRPVDVDGDGKLETRDVLILPAGKKHVTHRSMTGDREIMQATIAVSPHRALGAIYALVLLVVIAVTNVSVRGLWSVLFVLVVVMLTIVFALAGWWDDIFAGLNSLSVFINLGGYVLISSVLFVLWLINFALFDRQTYMIFTPGQVRIRLIIGGAETCYDTAGMVVQKQRNDLFRHWLLGFGSGDLLVRPMGVVQPFELPNVLGIAGVVRKIDNMIKEKVVVRGMNESR